VPDDPAQLGRLYQLASQYPALSKPLFHKVVSDTKLQDKKFRQTKYRHGLYEYALLHAAQDSLRSTQLLPYHSKTYLRAGDALAELRKLKESALYYQKAIELDPTLKERLEPVIERMERSQEFLEKAKGWYSNDTLRLALDVAG
jgi:tetratricopeptide (TPR) repeat protein